MQLLKTGLGAEESTGVFEVAPYSEFFAFTAFLTKANLAAFGGNVTLEFCPTSAVGTFQALTTGTETQIWTVSSMRTFSFHGGGWFRFTSGENVSGVDVYVGGPAIVLR